MSLSTANPPFRFLDLSRELRDNVYEIIAAESNTNLYDDKAIGGWRPASGRAMSQTNRQIRSEILRVLVLRNEIKFSIKWRRATSVTTRVSEVIPLDMDTPEEDQLSWLNYYQPSHTRYELSERSFLAALTFLRRLSPDVRALLRPDSQSLNFCIEPYPQSDPRSTFCDDPSYSFDVFPEWNTFCAIKQEGSPSRTIKMSVFKKKEPGFHDNKPMVTHMNTSGWKSSFLPWFLSEPDRIESVGEIPKIYGKNGKPVEVRLTDVSKERRRTPLQKYSPI